MLWIFLVLAFGVAAVAALILVRTLKLPSLQVNASPQPEVAINVQTAAERLAEAIRFRTISHQDPVLIDAAAFDALRQFLHQTFPLAHNALTLELVSEHSLLCTWRGRDKTLKPILLGGHTDVVPVEADTEGDWTYPAFEGRIADGFIWGRGIGQQGCGIRHIGGR